MSRSKNSELARSDIHSLLLEAVKDDVRAMALAEIERSSPSIEEVVTRRASPSGVSRAMIDRNRIRASEILAVLAHLWPDDFSESDRSKIREALSDGDPVVRFSLLRTVAYLNDESALDAVRSASADGRRLQPEADVANDLAGAVCRYLEGASTETETRALTEPIFWISNRVEGRE